jgi:iron complex outermembrane receptor protein
VTTTARSAAAVRSLLALGLFLLASAPASHGQTAKERKVKVKEVKGFGEDIEEIDLEKLIQEQQSTVGVASARPAPQSEAPGAVTVFKAEEIRNLGARTLLELLRFVPSFDVTFDNLGHARIAVRGIGSGTSRGGSQNVLVLWDGVRLNEGVTGGATTINLDLPLEHAKQVEVLRGPAAAVYGDGALAAVVSIVSMTTEEFMGTEGGVGLGSFTDQRYSLRSGGVLGSVKISGFIRFADTNGAQRLVPEDAQTAADQERLAASLPPISVAPGNARDGQRNLDAAYAFSTTEWTFAFRTKSDRADGFIGAAENLGRQTQLNTNQLGLEVRFHRALENLGTLRARAGFQRSETSDLLEIYPSGYRATGDFGTLIFGEPGGEGGVFEQYAFNSRRYGLEGTLERDLASGHKLTGGLELRRDSTYDLQANANFDLRTYTPVEFVEGQSLAPLPGAVFDQHRTTFGLLAEDQWTVDPRLTVTGGLRFDHLSDLGSTLNPRLAVVGTWRDRFGYSFFYGRAFRAPSFRERGFDLSEGRGNEDLRLVKADELELGLSFTRGNLRLEAHPFLSLVRDEIALPGPPGPVNPPIFANTAGVRAAGVELLASGSFGLANTFFANYTFQNATDRETDRRIPGLPRSLLNASVSFDVRSRVVLTPSLVVRSGRTRAPGDARSEVGGYALFGLTARSKNLWRTLEVALSFDNLFGKTYHDPSVKNGVPGDYPRPGRRVLVHVTYKF